MDEEKRPGVIYIGPQFRDSVLRTYKFYPEGTPEEYREDEIYKHLFVTAKELPKAKQALRRQGSALSVFFKAAIEQHMKKEG